MKICKILRKIDFQIESIRRKKLIKKALHHVKWEDTNNKNCARQILNKFLFICVRAKVKFKITITKKLILNLPLALTQTNLKIILKNEKMH